MQPIKSELESCKGCLEEAFLRIDQASGKGQKSKGIYDVCY